MKFQRELDHILASYSAQFNPRKFHDKDIYGEWLAQTYFFVRHSTSLLGQSMAHLKDDHLRHHFELHIGEEKKHDLLVLKDIERLGKKIMDFEESHLTEAFYQSQFYRINFVEGTALLGYVLFLEGLAVTWGKSLYEELKTIHPNSCLFLKVHAEEDPEHVKSAIETISKLSSDEREHIYKNLLYSHDIYHSMVEKIMSKTSVKKAA